MILPENIQVVVSYPKKSVAFYRLYDFSESPSGKFFASIGFNSTTNEWWIAKIVRPLNFTHMRSLSELLAELSK